MHVDDTAHAATVLHVDPSGADDASGAADAPLRTVARAVKLAKSGDRIVIAAGTYHEQVQVYGKAVHLAAAPGATVVFDGARRVTGWSAAAGDWSAPWTTGFARAGEPHTLPEVPEAGWPEQFFFDGAPLAEVTSRAAVVPGTFFYDVGAGRVWIGDDPDGHLVEGSDLAWGLYLNHADGSSLEGVTVRRYATPYTNMAAIRAYSNDLALRDVIVEDNAYMGVSAIGARIAIDRLTARRNGHLGAHAHRSSTLSITDSTIVDNNAHVFNFHHAAGGFKVTESDGVVVTDSTVSRNGGPAIWTDLSTTNIVVARNLVQGNSRHGIMIELSTAATIVDNVVTSNTETGIWVLESSDVRVWHNGAFDNFRDLWILDGPRADVFAVDVVNNTFGGGAAGAQSIVSVDDWTKDRSTAEMNLTMAGNRYWQPVGSPTPYISRFAHWPEPLALSATIEEHHAAAGLDLDADLSDATANPFARDPASGDYRQRDDAPVGRPLTAAVAAAADRMTGTSHPAGPLTPARAGAATPAAVSPPPAPSTTAPSTPAVGATVAVAAPPPSHVRPALPAVRLAPVAVPQTVVESAAGGLVVAAPAPAARIASVGWLELATAASGG